MQLSKTQCKDAADMCLNHQATRCSVLNDFYVTHCFSTLLSCGLIWLNVKYCFCNPLPSNDISNLCMLTLAVQVYQQAVSNSMFYFKIEFKIFVLLDFITKFSHVADKMSALQYHRHSSVNRKYVTAYVLRISPFWALQN